MDESLSDFRETKKSCAGPKNTNKSKRSKPKKAPKRIRGQKDIRTVLQSNNELESYSKDFDRVCKKVGIDVDPEQLQLAITLSKSLQDTASTSNENTQIANSTQDRIGKIRTTLQEYGFKVPEVKKATNARKPRKLRKNYKLILTSDSEKKEIIANKYSQVLFQNITHCDLYNSDIDTSNIPLYNLASNVRYNILKNLDTFYVNNLIEKSKSTGNLLRDWSEIPGRPVSPKLFDPSKMNFSEIECSQDELDIVLSGSLKRCQKVLSSKNKDLFINKKCKIVVQEDDVDNFIINKMPEIKTRNHEKTLKLDNIESENEPDSTSTAKQYRSCSPDIFDDDASSIFDYSKDTTIQEGKGFEFLEKSTTKANSEIMDITECVQNESVKPLYSVDEKEKTQLFVNSDEDKNKSNESMEIPKCILIKTKVDTILDKSESQLSQNNVTKRRSNDLMEMTECVVTVQQQMPMNVNIDLTEIHDIIDHDKNDSHKTYRDNVTFTEAKPNLVTTNDLDIDLTESPGNVTNSQPTMTLKEKQTDIIIESMDLTQSSNSSDELPFVSLTVSKNGSLDDTILVDVNEYVRRHTRNAHSPLQDKEEVHIDLTQNQESGNENNNHSQSFFEEFIHNHSGSLEQSNKSNFNTTLDIIENPVEDHHCNNDFKQCQPGKVDLTGPNRKSSSKNDTSSNSYKVPADNNISKSWSYTDMQNRPCDMNTLQSPIKNYQNNCSGIIAETIPGDYHLIDTSPKRLPGKVDLTQSLERKSSSFRSNHSNGYEELANNSGENSVPVEHHRFNAGPQKSKSDKGNLTLSPIRNPNEDDISDIDLTQNSNSSDELSQSETIPSSSIIYDVSAKQLDSNMLYKVNEITPGENSQRCSILGKKDDISIDYDELLDREAANNSGGYKHASSSIICEVPDEIIEKSFRNSFASNCSQNSEVFDISDKELDYSMHQSKLEISAGNFAFGGISIMDELSNLGSSKKSIDVDNINNVNELENREFPTVSINNKRGKEISPIKHRRITEIATPQKTSSTNIVTVVTPQNSELVIKTNNVTPMLDYESMTTPDIHKELDKYGIKPFKRKRAIQLLTHIYTQTHPIIESYADELASPPKRHKPNGDQTCITPRKLISPRKLLRSPMKDLETDKDEDNFVNKKGNTDNYKCLTDKAKENNITKEGKGKDIFEKVNQSKSIESPEVSKSTPSGTRDLHCDDIAIIRDIHCKPEDWVFQKREKAKVHSCRVPLHIAFHNYVASRRDLREAILCYEPVEIDVIHKDLVAYGHRYDPKDLLKFLDKKCITVKTTDNDGRNQKR